MQTLLNDAYNPITSTLGFIQAPRDLVVDAYKKWMTPIQAARRVSLEVRAVSGDLPALFGSLLPLTNVERRRFLFIPTKSDWTAFVDNGFRGTDAFSVLSTLSTMMKCRSCSVTAVLAEATKPASKPPFEAIKLEIYEPEKTEFLNYGRVISAVNDGGQWVFTSTGTAFPFEDQSQYKNPTIKDRFPFELLDRYVRRLGIRAFDEDYYLPDALLVEKRGPSNPKMKEFSLAEIALATK